MTTKTTTLFLILAALAITGCGSASVNASASTGGDVEPEPAQAAEPEPVAEEPVAVADPDDVHLDGDHITIDRHINFATNSDEILADSNDLLDHIAQFLANHSAEVKHLKVIGHTDRDGSAQANQELSERRAAAVVRALQSRGVTTQLEHLGKGKSDPLCSENTDECHAKNRRVEFLVIQD